MKTTIRIKKEKLNEGTISRNSALIIKETIKTITFEITTESHQAMLTEKQVKRNWENWIY